VSSITLHRTGAPPLAFRGQEIASAALPSECRNHSIEVYRTDGGRLVVCVEYTSDFRTELDHTDAYSFITPEGAMDWLRHYDCTSYVQGWPVLPQYEDRQRRLLLLLRERFAQLVTMVANQLAIVEQIP
jgi:hypothetical protein